MGSQWKFKGIVVGRIKILFAGTLLSPADLCTVAHTLWSVTYISSYLAWEDNHVWITYIAINILIVTGLIPKIVRQWEKVGGRWKRKKIFQCLSVMEWLYNWNPSVKLNNSQKPFKWLLLKIFINININRTLLNEQQKCRFQYHIFSLKITYTKKK